MKKVLSQDVNQIFKEKKVNGTCEICGHDDWSLLTNFATLVLQDTESVGLASYSVVAVECKNCGNLRLFGRARLGIEE